MRRSNIRKRWGVLFQGGALFSTLTVAENVEVPLREYYPSSACSCSTRSPPTRSR
jgi:ABC-type transporter Mla maintaining outer membrane lipid asymmetry ATPase subunit MlaF